MFYVEPAAGDPSWFEQIPSLRRDVFMKPVVSLPDIERRLRQATVTAITLPRLIRKHRLDEIDFIHVDTEGYDLEIIRQIDFAAAWAPRFVLYEDKHLSSADRRAARRLLKTAGFRFIRAGIDQFAYRRQASGVSRPKRCSRLLG
jgi:hypothetical protein